MSSVFRARDPLRISSWCWFCWFLFLRRTKVASADSYNAYQYDLTVPQFTPDGRLLQLEYARLASGHSAPILALPLSCKDEPHLLALVTYRPSYRLQERLVVHDISGSASSSSSSTKSIMIGFAGVIADCGALGRKVEESSMEHEQMYGTPFNTAQQWAMSACQYCQVHALGGGIRPFGASLVVAECSPRSLPPIISEQGEDERTTRVDTGTTNIFVTDPSGAVKNLQGSAIKSPTTLVGGEFVRESKLQRDLVSRWSDIMARCDTPAQRLACAFQLIRKAVSDTLRDGAKHTDDDDDNKDGATLSDLEFEVVLLSPSKGIFKVQSIQIKAILAQTVQAMK